MPPTDHLQDVDVESFLHNRADAATASSIQSHVRQCIACEEKLASSMIALLVGLSDKYQGDDKERRIGQRLQTGEPGFLQTLSPLSFERADVQILDASKGGLGLRLSSYLQSGTLVQVVAGATAVLGEVIYCRSLDGGKFHVGIRLHRAWPKPKFTYPGSRAASVSTPAGLTR